MQIWAESGKSALPICNYSQILYQFLAFTQNLKRSLIKSLIFSKIQSNKVLLVGGKGVLTPFRHPAPRKSGTFGSFGYKRTFTQSRTLKKL